jgi:hypothetical protein
MKHVGRIEVMNDIKRNLDCIYFRIGCENICFSDMTEEQRYQMMEGRSEEWLKSMCNILAKKIREIGDQFDLVCDHMED